ncbi:MAG: VOC family protein [Pseudomonadota bacterium]|nr:VOC family protein [Pseudomonadota bacterium]
MTYPVKDTLVWCEIPVTDMKEGCAFYSAVFDSEMEIEEGGPNPVSFFPKQSENDVAGHIYPGKPASNGEGITAHLHAPDTLEATVGRAQKAGAAIIGPIIDMPFGRFQYAIDPFGNSLGIFSMLK